MFVTREISATLKDMAKKYPVITITGPRQSGKTTLVRNVFPDYQHITLEDPDIRELAISDPREFLKKASSGTILDEIQRAPELTSYIQGIVDGKKKNGMFILTGSHQFELFNTISQSLAGRSAILTLLPFTFKELDRINKRFSADEYLLHGFYPGIHDRKLEPVTAYKNYFETYIQRDLRQIVNIKDLRTFQKFVRLCAGRIGQLYSASSLSNDLGVSVPTVNSWVSILAASYIVFFLEPYHENIGKRLIKSSKLYFYDVGLATYLLGIETTAQMERDPLRGNLFENMVIAELMKKRLNLGLDHNLYFYRDSNGNEVDVLYKQANRFTPAEIKAASTYTGDFLAGILKLRKQLKNLDPEAYLVYSGAQEMKVEGIHLLHFKNTGGILPPLKKK